MGAQSLRFANRSSAWLTYDRLLKSLQADSEALHASLLYILCGFGHLVSLFSSGLVSVIRLTFSPFAQLSAFSIQELFPFPLPVGQAFPRGVSSPVVAVHQEAAWVLHLQRLPALSSHADDVQSSALQSFYAVITTRPDPSVPQQSA